MTEQPRDRVPHPLTEDEFHMTMAPGEPPFPFFENEDGEYYAFGHVPLDALAPELVRYWRHVDPGEEYSVEGVDPANFQHLWVLADSDPYYPEEFRMTLATSPRPGWTPVTRYQP